MSLTDLWKIMEAQSSMYANPENDCLSMILTTIETG
jgi:hypothetical protein